MAEGSLAQAKRHKRKFDGVITIEEPSCRPNMRLRFAQDPGQSHLVLQFEDVDTASLGIRIATAEQVCKAIEFARQFVGRSLLMHCFHGVGRSTGIALSILADRIGARKEPNMLDQLLAVRSHSQPRCCEASRPTARPIARSD